MGRTSEEAYFCLSRRRPSVLFLFCLELWGRKEPLVSQISGSIIIIIIIHLLYTSRCSQSPAPPHHLHSTIPSTPSNSSCSFPAPPNPPMDASSDADSLKDDESAPDKPPKSFPRIPDDASPTRNPLPLQQDVCREVLRKLTEAGCQEVHRPDFADELLTHFMRLPGRYASDLNTERPEDVLLHQKLLKQAEVPENRPVLYVRNVLVLGTSQQSGPMSNLEPFMDSLYFSGDFANSYYESVNAPAYGKLESLSIEKCYLSPIDGYDSDKTSSRFKGGQFSMYEISFSTLDKPKLLSQLSSLLSDMDLNIREAHVYSTTDGYSLDVFLVDGWHQEDTEALEQALRGVISNYGKSAWAKASPSTSPHLSKNKDHSHGLNTQPPDLGDDWELDGNLLKLEQKVASGSFGDLYRGIYCGQDVAIKVLKHESRNEELEKEFSQEVFIMRKVRHKNVVQFIGACTKGSQFCIVTEFMAGGCLYDHLHKKKCPIRLPRLLRIALDVAKGMDYLHQNNIIHRDLKAANLLLDEHDVVKVADFGVARFQSQGGAMTAETGTYRWMAPEVISHQPYGHKVDVFSFGIVLWELLTGKLPYESMNPVQAAIGVRQGLRPKIPENTLPNLSSLIEKCWQADPAQRPEFHEISVDLQQLVAEVNHSETEAKQRDRKGKAGSPRID